MGFASSGLSAIGRLAAIALLAGAFLFGLAGVVYMSLQGAEVQVPEITGKDLSEGERELALLGLKIKKRADRASSEPPNTVIEQLPKPGETVKTGQLILVVTSKGVGEGEKTPIKKIEEDDSEKIEEMLDEKPKKPKANSNSRKKADTTRDVSANTGEGNSNSSESNSNKKESNNNSTEKNKNAQTPAGPKPPNSGTRPPADRPRIRQ